MSNNPEGIKAGDKVVLKSGGPLLTVSKVANDEFLVCQYFPQAHDGSYGEKVEVILPAVTVLMNP